MRIKRNRMHIDRANEVTVVRESAGTARPGCAFGLVTMPASRTLATGSSFGAGEARDAGLFGFMGEVINILSILPQGHSLVMVPAIVSIADTTRITDEETSHLVFNAEVDDLPCGLVAHIANTPLGSSAHLALGVLQFLPTAGVLLASALLLGKLTLLSSSLSFQRADAPPGHDQGCPRIRGHSSEVDFTQVNRRLDSAWGFFCLRDFDTDMQFKSLIPDQRAGTSFFWQCDEQHEGWSPSAHWQDHPPIELVYCLSRPVDGVEAFGTPGILHLHLWMLFAEFVSRFDGTEKSTEDRLHRLAMQGKPPFGETVQFMMGRPASMSQTCGFVGFHAQVPHFCGFHLRHFEALKEHMIGVQLVYTYRFHILLFFLSARKSDREWDHLWPGSLSFRFLVGHLPEATGM